MTWQKWGSKQALEKRKTNVSLMEVFNMSNVSKWGEMSTLVVGEHPMWAWSWKSDVSTRVQLQL
jgi:hypothetical protein